MIFVIEACIMVSTETKPCIWRSKIRRVHGGSLYKIVDALADNMHAAFVSAI